MKTVDVVSAHAGMHLTPKGGKISYCGKNDFWLYRTAWSGSSAQICKNCIKAMTKSAIKKQMIDLRKRYPLKVTYDHKEWDVVRRRYLQTNLLSRPKRIEVVDLKRKSRYQPRRSVDILLFSAAMRRSIRKLYIIDEDAST